MGAGRDYPKLGDPQLKGTVERWVHSETHGGTVGALMEREGTVWGCRALRAIMGSLGLYENWEALC